MNMRKMMQQAQQMQEKMARELAELEVAASVGGGMVEVKMDGHKNVRSVKIDPEAVDSEDTSMLEDLVLAAVNEAARQVDAEMQTKMGSLAGALGGALPGL